MTPAATPDCKTSDTRQTGRVCVDPRGPHFYVETGSFEGELPTGMPDTLFDLVHRALIEKFGDLNNVSWVNHIEPHTAFATATWDMDAERPSHSVKVEVDDKDDEWYTTAAHDYPWQ